MLVPDAAQADPGDATLTPGTTVSLKSVVQSGYFVHIDGGYSDYGYLDPVNGSSSETVRKESSFLVHRGLADPDVVSFESVAEPGTYLRVMPQDGMRMATPDGTADLAANATFTPVAGLSGSGTSLRQWNSDSWMRYRGDSMWVEPLDGSADGNGSASFRVRQGFVQAQRQSITPLADCYTAEDDGSYTVVLGYRNLNEAAVTPDNTFDPDSYNTALPTDFDPGTHHGVFTIRIAEADARTGVSWTLEGTTLNSADGVPTCETSEMPAFASGAALLAGMVLVGLGGAYGVRRSVRRATA